MDLKLSHLKKYKDKRGFLVEFLKPSELSRKGFIQFYSATIKPGKFRGNHYHRTKDECLVVIQGRVRLIIEDIFTKDHKEIILNASKEKLPRIKIRANIAHRVENISKKEAIIIGYSTEIPNPKSKDRWEYKGYDLLK